MNGKSPMISEAPPFVLRLSKDERRVFQQNLIVMSDFGAGHEVKPDRAALADSKRAAAAQPRHIGKGRKR